MICHGSSDINKDGWCVAISSHCTTAEPLNPIQRPSEISRCFRTRGATPGFLDPLPKQEHSERKPIVLTLSSKCKTGFAKHNACLQKVICNGNNTKAAILTSNYRFIKKVLLFFSTDLLPEFFLFILLGSIWIYVTTIIREQQWMPALSVGDITT